MHVPTHACTIAIVLCKHVPTHACTIAIVVCKHVPTHACTIAIVVCKHLASTSSWLMYYLSTQPPDSSIKFTTFLPQYWQAIMSLKAWLKSFQWGTAEAKDPASVHLAAAAAARDNIQAAGGDSGAEMQLGPPLGTAAGRAKRKRAETGNDGVKVAARGTSAAAHEDDAEDNGNNHEEAVRRPKRAMKTKPATAAAAVAKSAAAGTHSKAGKATDILSDVRRML
jgi:hypothetical protein